MQPVVLLVPGMSKPFAWASLGSPTEEFAVLQAGREQQSESKQLAGGNQRASGKGGERKSPGSKPSPCLPGTASCCWIAFLCLVRESRTASM